MKNKEASGQGLLTGFATFSQLQNDALNKALADYSRGIKDSITTKAGIYSKQTIDQQQGLAAEAHHVRSFNIEAAAKGQNNHRSTRDVGTVNDPRVDIKITTPAGTTEHQVKFYQDGESTAKALSPSKYDNVGKIVPKDQVGDVQSAARQESLRNQDIRPDVAKSYQHTAETATDTLSVNDGSGIKSTALNRKGKGSAEELVKETRKNNEGPKYSEKGRVRTEFNSMQYGNAAKSGAIAGATTAAACELYGLLSSDQPLTQEQCMAAAERIVLSSLSGVGSAVMVTGIQHVGQHLVDTAAGAAAKTLGTQIGKGNVASAVAAMTITFGQNLYQFSRGEIDSIEFAGSTIGNTVQIVGGSMSFSLGSGAAAFMGQWVAAEVASVAILGTTLGALGTIAVGVAFSIGFSLVLSAYAGHFSAEGKALAMDDITDAMALLNDGKINLSQYTSVVGSMSEFTFNWKDMLPFSGTISVFSEYSTRKNQLIAVQKDIQKRINSLPEDERALLYKLHASYQAEIRNVEDTYQRLRSDITQQAFDKYDEFAEDLDHHLELQYLMFAPVRKNYKQELEVITLKQIKQRQAQARVDAYTLELDQLQRALAHADFSDEESIRITNKMVATIQNRLTSVLPEKTGWDQAYEFLALH